MKAVKHGSKVPGNLWILHPWRFARQVEKPHLPLKLAFFEKELVVDISRSNFQRNFS